VWLPSPYVSGETGRRNIFGRDNIRRKVAIPETAVNPTKISKQIFEMTVSIGWRDSARRRKEGDMSQPQDSTDYRCNIESSKV
jgi:hypothetical protein